MKDAIRQAGVDPLRTDEKARLKELRDAQDHAIKMGHEADENAEAAGMLDNYRSEIGRYFGECGGVIASTPHQAWLKLEAAQNEAAMWKQKFEEEHKQPDASEGNSFSQNKAIRATFPNPDEAAAYMEVEFLSPSSSSTPHDTMRQIRARMRAFQRDTNTLADCLVREAARLESINGFVTIEDMKREAQALRYYADTLAPAAPAAKELKLDRDALRARMVRLGIPLPPLSVKRIAANARRRAA